MRGRAVPSNTALTAGLLLTLMAACLLLITARPAHASTFTVNSTGDDRDQAPGDGSCFTGNVLVVQGDECTLRAAIQEANASPKADTINFNIPSTGVNTISLASELDTITEPLTIDGYSQTGAKPNTLALGNDAVLKIELSGPSGGHGLIISAANSTVKGLVINRWGEGIRISGSGAEGNKVMGNYIGTDASGSQDLGNGGVGVFISGAPYNTIGGTKARARNTVSGNDADGVSIVGAGATGNKVTGNYVGTNANGTQPLGNRDNGVRISAPNSTIRGPVTRTSNPRNIISGNNFRGVSVEGANATGNKVQGNYVGTNASGTQKLGNAGVGVVIQDTSDNTIGGTSPAVRNIISGNDSHGVVIFGADATGNRILSNSINDNVGRGIDLGGDGITANDPTANKDSDTGPNNLQNFPELFSASRSGKKTTIAGILNSSANTTFTVQFFSSPVRDPSGFGEGKKFLGQKSVTTNASGSAGFNATTPVVPAGQAVSATATNETTGDTSEFSAAINAS